MDEDWEVEQTFDIGNLCGMRPHLQGFELWLACCGVHSGDKFPHLYGTNLFL